ncbi:uncharacterized protein LOC130633660 [Hydractinia symbiolongicarpus]|uniref:uncharacterized protein LOC130633660 n=1 Tax=Hydractinia symbiolongicarpus TaxID=13093 RepID=UPI00254BB082|nr:uncharacterized protein LOC130633660 [Hydractinia symbiolongicarpus]XP_057300561.1 uncharacterized protein LOC130633660 [Hydractinia symbiolongicarpus]
MSHSFKLPHPKELFGYKGCAFVIASIQLVLICCYVRYFSDGRQHMTSLRTPLMFFINYKEVILKQNSSTSLTEIPYIRNNSYLANFQIKPKGNKKNVNVLLIVSTGPRRYDRRATIRKTWWQQCKSTGKVVPECIFMTDKLAENQEFYNIIKNESRTYHDMHFQNLSGGVEFGKRFLYHMVYAVTNYHFDYFLRMDDDYFFCMEKFLHEIPVPMEKYFHWGWVHNVPNITRPEESMILFSRDVIELFLSQDPNKMLCHPLADQMVAAWSNHLSMTYLFRHDSRLHHHPPVRDLPHIKNSRNICGRFIGVHGAYPNEMKTLWHNRGKQSIYTTLKYNSHIVTIQRPFRWQLFDHTWQYEPKPCVSNPSWNTSKLFVTKGFYSGRQSESKEHH